MASTIVSRTQSGAESAAGRKTWTFSAWFKKTGLGSCELFGSDGDGARNNNYFIIDFNGSDQLDISEYTGGSDFRFITNRKFRDTSAWYHLVLAYDSTQGTSSNRVKIYINGVQETSFSTENYPSQDYQAKMFAQNKIHAFGRSTAWFNGCISHCHAAEGTAYAPTVFGETDSTTGEWKIKTDPSVSYGTNGFFLFKNDNSVTNQAGNSSGNFAVTAGTLTKTEDNPSNVFCTLNRNIVQAGGVSGRHANVSASLDNGNTTAGEGTGVFSNQLGTIFASSGKYYAECKFGGDQYCHFGVTSPNFSDASLGSYPGDGIGGVNSAGIYGNGGIARCNGATIFTDSNITTDTICLAMDLDNGALYIRRNDGSWMNSGNPESGATKTGAITLPSDTYTWIMTSHNNSGSGRNYMKINFGNGYFGTTAVSSAGTNASGNGIFEYDVPTGFTALSTKGLNL
jgi:hypothetical protein